MKILDSKRNLSRMNEIICVLIKYGFSGVAQKIIDKHNKHLPLESIISVDEYDMNTHVLD